MFFYLYSKVTLQSWMVRHIITTSCKNALEDDCELKTEFQHF